MSTLTVPLPHDLIKKIEDLVHRGGASSKADLARKALEFYTEELAVQAVLAAEREIKAGKILHGDLDALAKAI